MKRSLIIGLLFLGTAGSCLAPLPLVQAGPVPAVSVTEEKT